MKNCDPVQRSMFNVENHGVIARPAGPWQSRVSVQAVKALTQRAAGTPSLRRYRKGPQREKETIMALNNILGLFSAPITIHVDPDFFHFTTGTETLQLGTFLYLKKVDGKYAFHSAGGEAPTTPGAIRIDLFRNSELPSGVNRMEVLEAYLRHGIQKLSLKSRLIRPVITVQNIKSLEESLMGYQHYLMRPVLLEAGAREVRFE